MYRLWRLTLLVWRVDRVLVRVQCDGKNQKNIFRWIFSNIFQKLEKVANFCRRFLVQQAVFKSISRAKCRRSCSSVRFQCFQIFDFVWIGFDFVGCDVQKNSDVINYSFFVCNLVGFILRLWKSKFVQCVFGFENQSYSVFNQTCLTQSISWWKFRIYVQFVSTKKNVSCIAQVFSKPRRVIDFWTNFKAYSECCEFLSSTFQFSRWFIFHCFQSKSKFVRDCFQFFCFKVLWRRIRRITSSIHVDVVCFVMHCRVQKLITRSFQKYFNWF